MGVLSPSGDWWTKTSSEFSPDEFTEEVILEGQKVRIRPEDRQAFLKKNPQPKE